MSLNRQNIKGQVEERANVIDTLESNGGIQLDEDMKEALKEVPIKGWSRIKFINKNGSLSWDQMIAELEADTIIPEGKIKDQYQLLEFINDSLKKPIKPKKPTNVASRRKAINNQMNDQYAGTLKNTLVKVSQNLMKEVPRGRTKEQLKQKIKEIREATTPAGIESAGLKALTGINKALTKKSIDELIKIRDDVLEPFRKQASKRERSIKAKWNKVIHNALNWGIHNVLEATDAEIQKLQNTLNAEIAGNVDQTYQDLELVNQAQFKLSVLNLLTPLRDKTMPPREYETRLAELVFFIDKGQFELFQRYKKHQDSVNKDMRILEPALNEKSNRRKEDSFLSDVLNLAKTETVKAESPSRTIETTFSLDLGEKGNKRVQEIIQDSNVGLRRLIVLEYQMAKKFKDIWEKHFPDKDWKDYLKQKVDGSEKFSTTGKQKLTLNELLYKWVSVKQEQGQELAEYQKSKKKVQGNYAQLNKQLPEIEKILGPKLIQFAREVSAVLDTQVDAIDKQSQHLFGHSILAGKKEGLYYPMEQKRGPDGFDNQIKTVNFFQSFLNPRVKHQLPPQDVGFAEVFTSHIGKVGRFLHMSDPAIYNRDLFLNKRLLEKMEISDGVKYVKEFVSNVTDFSINEALKKEGQNEYIDAFRSYASITLMWGNVFSGARQVLGMPAVALHLGTSEFLEIVKEVPTKEEFLRIFNDPWIQSRMRGGFSEEMKNAIQQSGNVAWRKFINYGMRVPGMGDAISSAYLGAAMYRAVEKSGKYDGWKGKDKHDRIMSDIMQAVETTLQASMPAYMPTHLRRGGSALKAMFQFLSNPLLQVSFYSRSVQEIKTLHQKGKHKEANNKTAELAFTQHLMIPALQAVVSLAYSMLDGEIEEEEVMEAAMMLVAGPFAGIIMINKIVEELSNKATDRHWSNSNLPMYKLAGDIGIAYELILALIQADGEEIQKNSNKALKQLLPPVKHGSKLPIFD